VAVLFGLVAFGLPPDSADMIESEVDMKRMRPEIELLPRDWKSERPKPKEPIFGPGLPGALAYAVGWLFTVSVIYWAIHH
jgi:hypothetical protein